MSARTILARELAERADDPVPVVMCTTTALAIATGIGPRATLRMLEAMEAEGEVERREMTNAYRRQVTVWRPVRQVAAS